MAADDLALLAHRLDAGTNLHVETFSLLVAVDDATSGEVVGGELDLDPVAGEDADAIHPHAAGRMSQDLVAVVQPDLEHRVGQRLDDLALQRDPFLFGFVGRGSSLETTNSAATVLPIWFGPGVAPRGEPPAGATGRRARVAGSGPVHKRVAGLRRPAQWPCSRPDLVLGALKPT